VTGGVPRFRFLQEKIDIVVNAVGRIGPLVPVADTDPSEWTMTLSTNVIAPYLVLRAGLVNCEWFGAIKFRRLDRNVVRVRVWTHFVIVARMCRQVTVLARPPGGVAVGASSPQGPAARASRQR